MERGLLSFWGRPWSIAAEAAPTKSGGAAFFLERLWSIAAEAAPTESRGHPRLCVGAASAAMACSSDGCCITRPAGPGNSSEVVNEVRRRQLVGADRARLRVTVVADLVADLQRHLLRHADRETDVVLVVLVLRARFHQQRVFQRRVVGEAVLRVDQATADHFAFGIRRIRNGNGIALAVDDGRAIGIQRGAGGPGGLVALETGTDFEGEFGPLVLQRDVTVTDRDDALPEIGTEIVMLVTRRGHDVRARIELVAHRGTRVVTVGGGAELVHRVAIGIGDGHFTLGTKAIEEEVVLPDFVLLAQTELGVGVFRARVATRRGEAELTGARPATVLGCVRVLVGVGVLRRCRERQGSEDERGDKDFFHRLPGCEWKILLRPSGRPVRRAPAPCSLPRSRSVSRMRGHKGAARDIDR